MSTPLARLRAQASALRIADPLVEVQGRIVACSELRLDAVGANFPIGQRCWVKLDDRKLLAEVIGFQENRTLLMPLSSIDGLRPGASVGAVRTPATHQGVEALIGRVVNGLGDPLDGGIFRASTRLSIRCSGRPCVIHWTSAYAPSTVC